MVSTRREYFKNIDFLRILLCLGIILRHIHNGILAQPALAAIPLYKQIASITYGAMPVDCFFIISGFFLFFTTNFAQNFYQFALKKLIRLLPVVIFAIILYHMVNWVVIHKGVPVLPDVWELFMLHNIGFTKPYPHLENTWFLSVLFWVSCLYFYVYKLIDKKWFNLIMAGCVFLGYSFYFHSYAANYENVYYVINLGVMRGLAGMSLGYFIYNMYNDFLKNVRFGTSKIWQKLFCTVAEIGLLIFVFKNILYQSMRYNNKLMIILAFALLLILFIIKQGYIAKLLENNVSVFLGKFSFSIYVTHVIVRNLWMKYFCVNYPELAADFPTWNIFMLYTFAIVLGIITYYLIEKPSINFFGKKLAAFNEKTKAEN